jgi:two-component system KDP operon response regulator KdpE
LVIDDDREIRRTITAGLKFHGYSVGETEGGAAVLSAATAIRPDLIILDPAVSDTSGADVFRIIRSGSNVPIIILSFQSEEEHKVRFLRAGADDYMTKPFGLAELAARCEVVLRRYHRGPDNDSVVRTGPLTIDLVTRAVTLGSRQVTLARQEYRLLNLLACSLGAAITHDQLIRDIWGDVSLINVRYLRTLVRKLRQKLEVDPSKPKLLISESGVGYRLERNAVPPPRRRSVV